MVVVDVVHPKGREVEKEEEKKKERKIPGKRVPSSSYWIGDGALDNVKVNALPIPSPERKNPAKIQQKSQSISRITLLVTSIVLTRFEKTNHGYLVWLSGKKKRKEKKLCTRQLSCFGADSHAGVNKSGSWKVRSPPDMMHDANQKFFPQPSTITIDANVWSGWDFRDASSA